MAGHSIIHYRTGGSVTALCGATATTWVNTTRSGTKITCGKCHKILFKKPMRKLMVTTNMISVIFTKDEIELLDDILDSEKEMRPLSTSGLELKQHCASKVQIARQQLRRKNENVRS